MSHRPPPRGDRKAGPKRPPKSREETISRNLSYLLRHNAEKEDVHVDEGGWAVVADVLLWRKLQPLKVTLSEIRDVVENSDKKRFQLTPRILDIPTKADPTTDPSQWLIRAVQGHSMASVASDKLLNPVTASDPQCPNLVVHGTYNHLWQKIKKSGGLMPMSRNHIHFATKEPVPLPPQGLPKADEIRPEHPGEDKVMSGMRAGAMVMIWVDVRKSLDGGVKWWRSENNVYLTDGLEGKFRDEEGKEKVGRVLGFEWIRWVETRNKKEILFKSDDVDVERERLENQLKRVRVGDTAEESKGEGTAAGHQELHTNLKGLDGAESTAKRDSNEFASQDPPKHQSDTSRETVKESWDA